MKEIFVTDADDSHIAANQVAVRQAVANQRRKETLQSVITGLIGFFCVLGILAVIALLPVSNEVPAIVSYNAPAEEDDPKIEMKELAQNAKPKPPGASASMARVIASTETAPVFVPIPEMPSPDSLFGLEESDNYTGITNLALDRIITITETIDNITPNVTNWGDFFDQMIGVSFAANQKSIDLKLKFSLKRIPYVLTKPIHGDQRIDKTDPEKRTIIINLLPNNEMYQSILSFGSDVQVIEPTEVKEKIKEITNTMNEYYN